MNNLIFNKIRSVSATSRAVSGIGVVAILAVLFVLSLGSAQAVGTEQNPSIQSSDGDSGRILLAANDAYAAGEAKKDAKTTKESKDAQAKAAPKGPPPSKF